MSARKPLVLVDGETQQLQAADWIDLSDDINLTVSSPITLTDDDIGLDQSSVDHGSIGGLGDDDHTIYILADGTRDFSGVVVGVDPTASNHLTTKEYVDSAISFIEEFFLTDTASGISSYFNMVDQNTGEVESSDPTGSITQTDGQPLTEWITVENVPGVIDLEHGIYSIHIHAEKTGGGARDVRIYFEVWTRTHPGGSETLRVTSEVSGLITSKSALNLHATLTSDVVMNTTDRIVVKFFANGVSGGNNATIILYTEGDTASHFSVPISSEVLSTIFLRQDGTKALTGNMSVDAAITIDGRDLSVDGTKLDGIESLADVTDATNVAAAGAAMSGGAFHDSFSDYDSNEHIDHTAVSVSSGSGLTGGGTIDGNQTLALDINSLGAASIAAGDFIPFWDITATATNKKITFANFEGTLDHDSLSGVTANEHIDWTSTNENLSTSGSITTSTLTSGRVVVAGASGILEDSTNLTYNGTYLRVGTGFQINSSLTSSNMSIGATTTLVLDLFQTNAAANLEFRLINQYTTKTCAFNFGEIYGSKQGSMFYFGAGYTPAGRYRPDSLLMECITASGELNFAYPAAGSLNVYNTSNSLKLTMNSAGNLGLGVASPTAGIHTRAGGTNPSTAPLKFNSGALNSAAEAGAVEFLTDDFYCTITTGPVRQKIVLTAGLTATRVPFATTNGRLTDDSDLTFDGDTLSINNAGKSIPGLCVTSFYFQGWAVNNCWFSDNIYYDNSVAQFKRVASGYGSLLYYFQGDMRLFGFDTGAADSLAIAGGATSTRMQFLFTKESRLGLKGVNLNITAPTATLHISPGTAAASTAPFKLTSGTNLTTPEAGAIEFDGTNLYFTDSGNTRRTLAVV